MYYYYSWLINKLLYSILLHVVCSFVAFCFMKCWCIKNTPNSFFFPLHIKNTYTKRETQVPANARWQSWHISLFLISYYKRCVDYSYNLLVRHTVFIFGQSLFLDWCVFFYFIHHQNTWNTVVRTWRACKLLSDEQFRFIVIIYTSIIAEAVIHPNQWLLRW